MAQNKGNLHRLGKSVAELKTKGVSYTFKIFFYFAAAGDQFYR